MKYDIVPQKIVIHGCYDDSFCWSKMFAVEVEYSFCLFLLHDGKVFVIRSKSFAFVDLNNMM